MYEQPYGERRPEVNARRCCSSSSSCSFTGTTSRRSSNGTARPFGSRRKESSTPSGIAIDDDDGDDGNSDGDDDDDNGDADDRDEGTRKAVESRREILVSAPGRFEEPIFHTAEQQAAPRRMIIPRTITSVEMPEFAKEGK